MRGSVHIVSIFPLVRLFCVTLLCHFGSRAGNPFFLNDRHGAGV